MTHYSTDNPFPQFNNLSGTGLNGGSVYIGVAGQDPELFPITVYWDDAGANAALQPLATIGGYISHNGSPATIFMTATSYSIRVYSQLGAVIYYNANVNKPLATFIADLAATASGKGAGLLGFSHSASYSAGTVGAKLKDEINVKDAPYNCLGDGTTNDYAGIAAALATGKPIYFPSSSGSYNFATGVNVAGTGNQIRTDDDVVLRYTGTAGAAITITGTGHNIDIGEILAPSAPYVVKYYNLEYSKISIRRPGQCTTSCIFHDAALQTQNAGNVRWIIGDIQAGSVPYGIKIDSHATYTIEGEIWDVGVILSATTCALVVGSTTANQKVRWNEYNICIDAQGITPMLVDIYNDFNQINLRNWAGVAVPPIGHVRFNTGTGSCILIAATGTQGELKIVDSGDNFYFSPIQAGQMALGGISYFTNDESAGTDVAVIENRSIANGTGKYAGLKLRGRDTTNSGKDAATARAYPVDADWINAELRLQVRRSDALSNAMILFGTGTPQGVVTAPVGAIYTRQDGGAGTTLYVKESGVGNTGWVGK